MAPLSLESSQLTSTSCSSPNMPSLLQEARRLIRWPHGSGQNNLEKIDLLLHNFPNESHLVGHSFCQFIQEGTGTQCSYDARKLQIRRHWLSSGWSSQQVVVGGHLPSKVLVDGATNSQGRRSGWSSRNAPSRTGGPQQRSSPSHIAWNSRSIFFVILYYCKYVNDAQVENIVHLTKCLDSWQIRKRPMQLMRSWKPWFASWTCRWFCDASPTSEIVADDMLVEQL